MRTDVDLDGCVAHKAQRTASDLAEHMGASRDLGSHLLTGYVTLRSELKCSIGICSFSLKNSIIYGR